uniref:Uncharacterized protein n=1 Tax=Anopheles atroparvus TaxID=41427 RepID=A0A182JAT2_ANOAO
MMSSSGEAELRDAFDRFSLWTLVRHVDTAATVNLIWCGSIQPNLRNYMLAVAIDRDSGGTEHTLLEHYLTKTQYLEVSQRAREDAKRNIGSFLNVPSNTAFVHYVHVTNEQPTVEVNQPGITLLKTADMTVGNRSSIPSHILCAISIAREMEGAHERNVYGMCFSNGKTMRKELLEGLSNVVQCVPDVPPCKPQYCVDALPMNSINLDELAKDLGTSSNGGAPLGLFLVRQGVLDDVKRYLKRNCVDRLEDVTADTWFLVSETVPFDAHFREHASVHEVAQLKDYGVILWQRSRGIPTPIGKYFCNFFWDQYDSVPPAPGWLNVLVSNETDGSTTYMQKLVISTSETDPFRMVAVLQAIEMMDVLRQRNSSTLDKLCALFGAHTDIERNAVDRGYLLLVVDHAIEDNGMGFPAQELVDFFNMIDKHRTHRLKVWVVGNDRLWERIAINCNHGSIKYVMPPLDERGRKECLSLLLNEPIPDVESVVRCVEKQNSTKVKRGITENVFFLAALADTINGNKQENVTPAYWWIEVLERFVWKHFVPEGSSELATLEEECYNRFVSLPETLTPLPSAGGLFKHRTLVKLLAAKYLVQRPHMIDVETYRLFGHELLDLLLFRHSPVGIAVLQNDIDTVRMWHTNSPDTLLTATDCLQRNLLHVVHESKEIEQLLLSAGVAMEQQCVQLKNWTPLQVADDRGDWPLVDRLLANGAKMPADDLRLHKMTLSELQGVFSDCIRQGCESLIQWICDHRSDYLISQEDVYTMVVMQEFNDQLRFRLLAQAVDQRLPERDPEPYQYIWYNTALDSAVEDDRYDLAAFLVEKLHFPPTESFYAMQKQSLEGNGTELDDYKTLYKVCAEGNMVETKRMIQEKGLDPTQNYGGTNLFIQAAGSGNLELVRFLYELHAFKERLNEEDEHGNTAMSRAMQRGCDGTVHFLYECGAVVNPALTRSYPGELPEDAISIDTEDFGSLITLKKHKLEQLNIDYNRLDDGDLLLHFYIGYVDEPDESTFRYLLAQYADVDIRTSPHRGGITPLHVALKFGNERCAEILIEAGADVHAKSLDEQTSSLHFAIMGGIGKPMLARLIEQYGVDVNTRDQLGRTVAFHLPPDRSFYHWLIHRYGLDVYARDYSGDTILHYQVQKGTFFGRSMIEFLLTVLQISQGLTNNVGRLALHCAVEAANLEIVRLLIKYRPDLVDVPDGQGLTALQLARNGGNRLAIKELLESISSVEAPTNEHGVYDR